MKFILYYEGDDDTPSKAYEVEAETGLQALLLNAETSLATSAAVVDVDTGEESKIYSLGIVTGPSAVFKGGRIVREGDGPYSDVLVEDGELVEAPWPKLHGRDSCRAKMAPLYRRGCCPKCSRVMFTSFPHGENINYCSCGAKIKPLVG
ncbi:MAG: hypothetical protein Q8P86_01790 [bacterium]|nr:hypothetical protein [bacterium]